MKHKWNTFVKRRNIKKQNVKKLELLQKIFMNFFLKMKTSYIEVVDMIIESLVEKGEYVSPEPYMNLEYAIARLQQAYNLAIIEKVPDDRMELLRRWISQANSLIELPKKIKPLVPSTQIPDYLPKPKAA